MHSRHAAAQQENSGDEKQQNGEEQRHWQQQEKQELAVHRVNQKPQKTEAEFYEDERCVSTALSSAFSAVQLRLKVHRCRIDKPGKLSVINTHVAGQVHQVSQQIRNCGGGFLTRLRQPLL